MVRLAAAFDAAGVAILPGCADPFGPKAIRASAGAILNVAIATIGIEDLDGKNLFAADGSGDAIEPPARDAVLVFGSEGAGVSDALRSRSKRIAVPMSPRVESLNVAAAAAILLARSYALR
jgi:TrmH family RNA methyltransferase